MYLPSRKGERRLALDILRLENGEPKINYAKNTSPNCRYAKEGKAFRNKGRNRFKTGRKRQKRGKKNQ